MANVQNDMRIYSQDNKIWIGMKVVDAYKTEEDMRIFNFADRDGDGEISDWELDRYNGPLLVDKGVDYYPGLKIESVDKAGRVVYGRIDTNHDNELSVEEMETVVDAKQRIDKHVEKTKRSQNSTFLRLNAISMPGLLGYMFAKGTMSKTYRPIRRQTSAYKIAKAFSIGIPIAAIGGVAAVIINACLKSKKEVDWLEKEMNKHPYIAGQKDEILRKIYE